MSAMTDPDGRRERGVMGDPEPDEQRTDVMGGAEPGEHEVMGEPEPDEQRTDLMGGAEPRKRSG
jgi:hypothetical protein